MLTFASMQLDKTITSTPAAHENNLFFPTLRKGK
jgi:hypothetical protein